MIRFEDVECTFSFSVDYGGITNFLTPDRLNYLFNEYFVIGDYSDKIDDEDSYTGNFVVLNVYLIPNVYEKVFADNNLTDLEKIQLVILWIQCKCSALNMYILQDLMKVERVEFQIKNATAKREFSYTGSITQTAITTIGSNLPALSNIIELTAICENRWSSDREISYNYVSKADIEYLDWKYREYQLKLYPLNYKDSVSDDVLSEFKSTSSSNMVCDYIEFTINNIRYFQLIKNELTSQEYENECFLDDNNIQYIKNIVTELATLVNVNLFSCNCAKAIYRFESGIDKHMNVHCSDYLNDYIQIHSNQKNELIKNYNTYNNEYVIQNKRSDSLNANIGSVSDSDYINIISFDNNIPIVLYISKLFEIGGIKQRQYKIIKGGIVPINNDELNVPYSSDDYEYLLNTVVIDYTGAYNNYIAISNHLYNTSIDMNQYHQYYKYKCGTSVNGNDVTGIENLTYQSNSFNLDLIIACLTITDTEELRKKLDKYLYRTTDIVNCTYTNTVSVVDTCVNIDKLQYSDNYLFNINANNVKLNDSYMRYELLRDIWQSEKNHRIVKMSNKTFFTRRNDYFLDSTSFIETVTDNDSTTYNALNLSQIKINDMSFNMSGVLSKSIGFDVYLFDNALLNDDESLLLIQNINKLHHKFDNVLFCNKAINIFDLLTSWYSYDNDQTNNEAFIRALNNFPYIIGIYDVNVNSLRIVNITNDFNLELLVGFPNESDDVGKGKLLVNREQLDGVYKFTPTDEAINNLKSNLKTYNYIQDVSWIENELSNMNAGYSLDFFKNISYTISPVFPTTKEAYYPLSEFSFIVKDSQI